MKCPAHGTAHYIDCAGCETASAAVIGRLPFDYFDLMRHCERRHGARQAGIARQVPGSSPPIDLHIDALARSIAWTLTTWEPAVREAARLAPETTRAVRQGWAVSTAAAVLAAHVATLAGLRAVPCYADGPAVPPVTRDGLDAIAECHRLHQRTAAALGIAQVVIILPGLCSNGCNGSTLRRIAGAETVWCGSCNRRWTYDEYRTYVRLGIAAT